MSDDIYKGFTLTKDKVSNNKVLIDLLGKFYPVRTINKEIIRYEKIIEAYDVPEMAAICLFTHNAIDGVLFGYLALQEGQLKTIKENTDE